MDLRYDRVFLLLILKKKNLQKWGKSFRLYQNVQKGRNCSFEGSLKELGRIPDGSCKGNAGCSKRNLEIDSTKHR